MNTALAILIQTGESFIKLWHTIGNAPKVWVIVSSNKIISVVWWKQICSHLDHGLLGTSCGRKVAFGCLLSTALQMSPLAVCLDLDIPVIPVDTSSALWKHPSTPRCGKCNEWSRSSDYQGWHHVLPWILFHLDTLTHQPAWFKWGSAGCYPVL